MGTLCQWYILHPFQSQYSKEKQLSFFHAVHESVIMGKMLVGHIPSTENAINLITKFFIDRKGSTWSAIFYMIYMITISNQKPFKHKLKSGKFDPIDNSIIF